MRVCAYRLHFMHPAKRARVEPWPPRINEHTRAMLVRTFFNTRQGLPLDVEPPRAEKVEAVVQGATYNLRNLITLVQRRGKQSHFSLTEYVDRDGHRFYAWHGDGALAFGIQVVTLAVQPVVDNMRRPEALDLALRSVLLPSLIEHIIVPYLHPTEGVSVYVQFDSDALA